MEGPCNEDWQPTYDVLQNPEKRILHDALIREQGHVCCYCGRRIGPDDSHIEHFRPQEFRPDLQLEFSNLHASCIKATKPGQPLHCGHAKGARFDEALAISCLDADCEKRFVYALDGHICPERVPPQVSDSGAAYMIDLLNLNVGLLRVYRQQTLDGVFDNDFLATATDKELRLLVERFRSRGQDGLFAEFGHVVARFAEQRLAG